MANIRVESVTKRFRGKAGEDMLALDRVDVSVSDGDFLCLLGPSGCGKSTLLNMIAGFEYPTTGTVSVDGDIVSGPGADRGMVFQQATLMPWLNVWENVAFHARLKGVGRRAQREQAQPFIEMVGLAGFENHLPAQLSGGMRQRVGIARVLLMNPRVILMDEPFGALDEQTKMQMQAELTRIWEVSGATIVFVTHGIDEALTLGTHVAVMSARPGRIAEFMSVELPRPRDITSMAFNNMKRHVLSLLSARES
ncbi:ABC transporter ATP-binding protein [Gluconacetobacter sp. Hr-1-5]|uniref:ABC transporter ATP-binding protein n=1 Tax=Gluconacetobacter sp. Hr-1-5 TaxID=3395370 RepID=UPI003B52BCCE